MRLGGGKERWKEGTVGKCDSSIHRTPGHCSVIGTTKVADPRQHFWEGNSALALEIYQGLQIAMNPKKLPSVIQASKVQIF